MPSLGRITSHTYTSSIEGVNNSRVPSKKSFEPVLKAQSNTTKNSNIVLAIVITCLLVGFVCIGLVTANIKNPAVRGIVPFLNIPVLLVLFAVMNYVERGSSKHSSGHKQLNIGTEKPVLQSVSSEVITASDQ